MTTRDFSTHGAVDFVQEMVTNDMSWGEMFDIYTAAHARVESMTDDESEKWNDLQALQFLSVVMDQVLRLFETNGQESGK